MCLTRTLPHFSIHTHTHILYTYIHSLVEISNSFLFGFQLNYFHTSSNIVTCIKRHKFSTPSFIYVELYKYICVRVNERTTSERQNEKTKYAKKNSRLNLYCTVIVLRDDGLRMRNRSLLYCFAVCVAVVAFFLWYFLPFSQYKLRKTGNNSVNMAEQNTNKYV